MDQVVQILSRVTLFQGIKENQEALQQLEKIMHFRSFIKNHNIITEGDYGDEAFILIEGQVSVFKNTPDGDHYKVVILRSNNTPTFGEGALIESEPRSATVRCDSDCKCLVLGRDEFHEFANKYPAWSTPILLKVASALMGRLRQTSNDMMLLYKALIKEIRTG